VTDNLESKDNIFTQSKSSFIWHKWRTQYTNRLILLKDETVTYKEQSVGGHL